MATLTLLLAMGEVVARVSWPEPPPPPAKPELDEDLPVIGTVYELGTPNMRGRHKGVLHRVNSRGFRGPEYAADPSPGTFRIGIAGDSITQGWGVTEEHSYAGQLETMLNERSDGRRYEVLNFGLAGLHSEGVMNRLASGARSYSPQLLIYGFTVNDIQNGAFEKSKGEHRPQWQHSVSATGSWSYLFRWAWPRLVTARMVLFAPPGSKLYDFRHNYFENPAAWDRFVASLDRMAEIAEASGACGGVLMHTQIEVLGVLHPYGRIYDRVEEAALERGLFVVPTLDDFRGLDERTLRLGPFDFHPNRRGHEILAKALAKRLPDLGPTCWGE